MTPAHPGDHIKEQLHAALVTADVALLESLLAEDARFESCVGRSQVLEHVKRIFRSGVSIERAESEEHADRLVTRLALKAPEPEQLPFGKQCLFAVTFIRNGHISELQVVDDRDKALAAVTSPPPSARPATQAVLSALAPVLPVRDLDAALDHYNRLGFSVHAYDGGGYGYAARDGLNLHLAVVRDLDPATTTSAIYLYVDDADRLYAEWRAAGVSGQFFEPHDTDYALREGAHVDRDGNLLRFGSSLQK